MHHTFRATRRFALFGLYPGDHLTVDDAHPEYVEIRRQAPANFGGILGGLIGGDLECETPVQTAAETEELVRMVAGLPRPSPLSARRSLRLVE